MKYSRASAKVAVSLLGIATVASVAGIWGTAIAQIQRGSNGPEQLMRQIEPPTPDWTRAATAGDWCGTQVKYDVLQTGSGRVNFSAACMPYGAPDDPAVRDSAIPTPNTPIKTIQLSIHVFCENNGTNPAATAADVQTVVNQLNAIYLPWRIQFVHEWRFVNSSKYRLMDTSEEWQMKKTYAISPATKLNMFVVTQNQGYSWGTFPWDSSSLTFMGGIVFDSNHFKNGGTPAHEVGHCIGLWHTFHGTVEVDPCSDCYEPAGRSPEVGDTTGDKCSDTQPTPRLFACVDPVNLDSCNGQPWLDIPHRNYMGYANCSSEFTYQQAGRMHAWIDNSLTGWLVLPQPPTAPGTPSLTKLSATSIRLIWADNSSDETTFEFERQTKSGNSWGNTVNLPSVGANTTTTTDATLPGAGTYRYRVRAVNGIGASAWSGYGQIKI